MKSIRDGIEDWNLFQALRQHVADSKVDALLRTVVDTNTSVPGRPVFPRDPVALEQARRTAGEWLRASTAANVLKLDDLVPRAAPRWPFRFRSMYTNPCHLDGQMVAPTPTAAGHGTWRNLPLVFGACAATATTSPPLCYVQQLETAARHNLSTMIILEEAGPFVSTEPTTFENGTANPHARYHTTCADDCSWPPSVRPWRLRNASTAPVRGVCGLKWLSKTLDFLRPYVEKGTLQGFSEFSRSAWSVTIDSDVTVATVLGDEMSTGGWPRESLSAAAELIHSKLAGLPHFVCE